MCFGNLSPIASRTSTSDLPTRSLAAANPLRSGTVSRSQTMTLGFMRVVTVPAGGQTLGPRLVSRQRLGDGRHVRQHGNDVNDPIADIARPIRYAVAASGCSTLAETDRGGTFSNRDPNPSAMVGCVRIASRSV